MAKYLLDTNVIIDLSKGRGSAHLLITALAQQGNDVGTCAIVVAEFFSGIAAANRAVWRPFFANLHYWTIDSITAERAGHYRYAYRRQGRQLSVADTLIAAVAYMETATVITGNANDFPMTDITILVP